MFQYLAEQVLERQTPPVQDFLLRTSLFDEFNTDLCNLVLGDSKTESWAEMIGVLQQENLFVQQVDDENSWIRYHSLFKDFLRVRFHDLHPEEEEKIYSRLITIYRESESWEKAFATAMQIGNPDLMAEVIDQAHSTLVHQGRMQLLHSWLELLPEEGFKSFPILYILRGICYTAIGNPKKGLSYISNIINKSSIASDQYLFTRALLCRTTTSRMLGRYDDALFDINLIFKDHLSKNIDETLLAETYREAGLAYLNIGNYSKSKDYFVQSINSYIELDNINNQALVHQDLGLLLMEHGNFHGASSHFDIAIKTWASQNNTSRKSNILNNKGTLSVLTGNYRKSAELLHKAISNSEVSSDLRMLAFAIASQGDLAKSLSLYEIGLDRYDKANKISEEILEGYLLYYLAINKSSLYRLMGRCDKAKELIQVARTFILQGSSQNEIGMWHLEKGFLHLAQNEYRSSRESFLQAEKTFRITEKPIELAKARMGLVLASYELDKPRTTQDHIKDWIACLIKLETNQPLLPELHFHGEIIEAALEKSLPNPALDTLLADLVIYRKRLPRLQKEIFPEQEQDPLRDDKLEIFALGRNQVFIRGEKITSPEWIYQKTVRELFFYLLTLPRGATKEQIGLVFWPDSSPSQLTCQFKNAIYRMRRAIGREAIIYDPETRTYSFNLDQPYTYDVEKFLSLLQKAENEPRVADRIKYYQEAVGLYDHPYSPQAGGVWAEPIRQSLSRKHEQALLTIAEHQLAKNQHQTCLKYCQIVLDIEPCQEKAFHLSLRACAKANDRTSLIRYYEEYKKNLLEHLNIKPSKSTTRLFKELLG